MTNPQFQQIGQVTYNKKPLAGLSENLKINKIWAPNQF